jgi:sporulation protein YlmC with PRC-barrel domain
MKKIMMTATAMLFSVSLSTTALAVGGYPSASHTGPVETPAEAKPHDVSGILPTNQILGKDVVNPQGKKLGEIKTMLVDVNTGNLAYVVIADHPVPWKAIRANAQQKKFTLDISEEQFKKSPKGEMIPSQDEEVRINDYYGVAPYWEEGVRRMPGTPSHMENGGEGGGSMGE